ncbi:hypothetical protein Hypma_005327 [Hypsizygus marmoreus]|uniref:Glycosyltransferase 2-like domain-containing protein n=1 Tax=Hypsizygus marmoreus TaxID=39966 RepID=A0A369JWY4_HYPMA|nr:hypothetical protein Hypma_005327 [Hypsizygus marmoreus]
MDYDRNDALLHWLFRQTQGDAWFRPNEENISSGVALRISDVNDPTPEFRVFPYENPTLEPFEVAVAALNPVVAVKIRNAAVHAALASVAPEEQSIYVDANTRIQILDTMLHLPAAEKEQCAAFIRDERVLVIWSDSLDRIIPTCTDFEERLIKLLWRAQPGPTSSTSHSSSFSPSLAHGSFTSRRSSADGSVEGLAGLGLGISVFIGTGIRIILQEFTLDGSFIRFALVAVCPLLYCVSLFFALQLIQNVSMVIGPIEQYHANSKYYSALKPRANKAVDDALPHVTIQMPVYKEGLEGVLAPSIRSLKKAMQTYARQGGTSTIFVCDDGLRILPLQEREARLAFYANHGVGWVARPAHGDVGLALSLKLEHHLQRLLTDAHIALLKPGGVPDPSTNASTNPNPNASTTQLPVQPATNANTSNIPGVNTSNTTNIPGVNMHNALSLEDQALALAIEEVWEESGRRHRPWACNGRATRMGEIVLIVDSDTVVPEDCLRDAAREMSECPDVAIIQHESGTSLHLFPFPPLFPPGSTNDQLMQFVNSTYLPTDVMQVAHHYFENGIAYFTRRVNRCISMACANGEVAPFMGHNAFLRWRALQDAAFTDTADGRSKIWSETNVSEDFDMALRLMMKGYTIRWATYSHGGFKEGVSLSVDDELNRWQKYAYGCSELLFNPLIEWFRRGPIAHQIHKFLWSSAPMHYKVSMMAYMFSYYGIAGAVTIGVINYVLLGFQFGVDGFYRPSFELWLATTVVFFGSGNVGYSLLEYRLGHKQLIRAFLENLMWIPFFFFFFGGLSIPVSQAVLAHLFSYNISWSATIKEVQRSNFFKEIPKIAKRFWFPMLVSIVIMGGMIVCATSLVPLEWRVDGVGGWAVIFPLAILAGCHILFPIVLNPWLMVFSY